MENIETKQKIIGIVYLLAFVSLFTGLFTIISNLAFMQYKSSNFFAAYATTNWVCLALCVVGVVIILYNFFARKKLVIVEIVFDILAIAGLIVMLILNAQQIGYVDANVQSLYSSYMGITMQILATFVLLLGTRIVQKFVFANHTAVSTVDNS